MRTIRLQEQQATRCRLSKAELGLLLSVERAKGRVLSIGVRDAQEGVYELRAGSVVGTLAWPSLQVLIRPKVKLENVFFLLGFRGGLARWTEDPFPYQQEREFLPALAWAFDAAVRRALRYGVARDYLSRVDTLVTLRGRIDIGRQLRTRQDQTFPLECSYQEYSHDITLNRLIKAAQRRLLGVPGLGRSLTRLLGQSRAGFTDVADVEYPPAGLPEVQFTRLNRHWQAATKLALMILRQEALRDETGTAIGTAFTVDMNALFEKFIEEVVHEEAISAGLSSQPQRRVRLTDQIAMRPDLVLGSGQQVVAVGDAKYVELEPSGWPHANLYQLLAYCVALGLPRGLLVYASPRAPEIHRVTRAGVELEIIGLDLSQPPKQLVEQACKAAGRLVAHARALTLAASSARGSGRSGSGDVGA